MTDTLISSRYNACQVCWSKDQQILAKDEVIRAKDAVIAAKDDAIAQKDAALKAERELREQLQRQIKMATSGVSKKSSMSNLKSASCRAQEEKDALTIYIRNVTERITYEMLYEAFSAFGMIRTLNVLHPKACAFVEFSSPDAYQRALSVGSVPVGDCQYSVVTEKRVRRPPQAFVRRPSRDNLRSGAAVAVTPGAVGSASSGNYLAAPGTHQNIMYSNSNSSSTTSINSVESSAMSKTLSIGSGYEENVKVNVNSGWLRREDEGCDLTPTY